jgi:hypothetical protein
MKKQKSCCQSRGLSFNSLESGIVTGSLRVVEMYLLSVEQRHGGINRRATYRSSGCNWAFATKQLTWMESSGRKVLQAPRVLNMLHGNGTLTQHGPQKLIPCRGICGSRQKSPSTATMSMQIRIVLYWMHGVGNIFQNCECRQYLHCGTDSHVSDKDCYSWARLAGAESLAFVWALYLDTNETK